MVKGLTVSMLFALYGLCSAYGQVLLQDQYNLYEIGTFGGQTSHAFDINNNRQVVGYADDRGGVERAFLYVAGVLKDIATSEGGWSAAYSINDSGVAVGYTQGFDHYDGNQAFIYAGGPIQPVASNSGIPSGALGINNNNQVTGYATFDTEAHSHMFISASGKAIDSGIIGVGIAINDVGQAVGYSGFTGYRAFLFSGGVKTELGTLHGGQSFAYAINSVGQIVGTSDGEAFLYQNGAMKSLGLGTAFGINNQGWIVGSTANQKAFLYKDNRLIELNSLLPVGSGWNLTEARAVNELGDIVGVGINSTGQERGFILSTAVIPEPVTIAWIAAYSLCFIFFYRRRRMV